MTSVDEIYCAMVKVCQTNIPSCHISVLCCYAVSMKCTNGF